jgi:hypothetical protein
MRRGINSWPGLCKGGKPRGGRPSVALWRTAPGPGRWEAAGVIPLHQNCRAWILTMKRGQATGKHPDSDVRLPRKGSRCPEKSPHCFGDGAILDAFDKALRFAA